MVELTVEKIILISMGLIFALIIAVPFIMNILEIIKFTISGIG